MTPRARIVETEHGLVAEGEGWYVVNAREAAWEHADESGAWCTFEGDARFEQLGINVSVLRPGQRMAMYHAEDAQEDFLVLDGEAVLVVEDEELPLRRWDFFHCPPNTPHVIAAGEVPCTVLAVGARRAGRTIVYPVSDAAARHGASVTEETTVPREAYTGWSEPRSGPAPELP